MVKVVIYEDNVISLIAKYSQIIDNNEVHIRIDSRAHLDIELLSDYRFNPENIKHDFGNPETEDADLYFIDGLKGDCFRLIKKLPRERTFLFTGDESLNRKARKIGVNLVNQKTMTVEEIVEKFNSDREIV